MERRAERETDAPDSKADYGLLGILAFRIAGAESFLALAIPRTMDTVPNIKQSACSSAANRLDVLWRSDQINLVLPRICDGPSLIIDVTITWRPCAGDMYPPSIAPGGSLVKGGAKMIHNPQADFAVCSLEESVEDFMSIQVLGVSPNAALKGPFGHTADDIC